VNLAERRSDYPAAPLRPSRGLWSDAFRRLLKNRLAVLGGLIVSLFILFAIFAPLVAPAYYAEESFQDNYAPPGGKFLMGADYFAIRDSWLSGVVNVGGVVLPVPQIAAVVGASLATALLYLLVFRTSVGRQLRAASQDAQAASTLGINVTLMYALAWGIGAACVGVAASLLSNFYYIFPRVGAVFVLLAYVAVALGGFGSIHGALVAGVLIGLLQVVIGFFVSSELKYVPVYMLYLAVVLLRPRGLFGRS